MNNVRTCIVVLFEIRLKTFCNVFLSVYLIAAQNRSKSPHPIFTIYKTAFFWFNQQHIKSVYGVKLSEMQACTNTTNYRATRVTSHGVAHCHQPLKTDLVRAKMFTRLRGKRGSMTMIGRVWIYLPQPSRESNRGAWDSSVGACQRARPSSRCHDLVGPQSRQARKQRLCGRFLPATSTSSRPAFT